ncbi:hypothetical protein EPO05_04795 [Patescibacteria group bacterium]|nr:MAG: hypothetical protein EPO05_04795 [Patescibacteria group bacterium]
MKKLIVKGTIEVSCVRAFVCEGGVMTNDPRGKELNDVSEVCVTSGCNALKMDRLVQADEVLAG